MEDNEQDYLTIIGANLLIPLIQLLETLKLSGVRSVNEVQTSPFENGYATAIILLDVLFLESMLNRTKYFMDPENKQDRTDVITFFNRKFEKSRLCKKVEELFVIRDVIAHNHIWEAKIAWDKPDYSMKLISANLLENFGDKKFRRVTDFNNRKTKLLKVNLFPTRICWSDIVTVLKTTLEILLFLEREDSRYVYISNEYVEFDGEYIMFVDLVNSLE